MVPRILLLIALSFSFGLATAQDAVVQGQVFDSDGEIAMYAEVLIKQETQVVNAGITDDNGKFEIQGIKPGSYDLEVYYGDSLPLYVERIKLGAGSILIRNNLKLGTSSLKTVILNPVNPDSKPVVEIVEVVDISPEINVLEFASPTVRTNSNGSVEVGNGRPGGTNAYLGNSVESLGRNPMTLIGLTGAEILDFGVSARYGNFTGGGVQYQVKPILADPETYFQMQSTSPFNGYHHNLGILYLSRAPITKSYQLNDRVVKKTVFGYSILGTYKYQADPLPSFVRPYMLTDEAAADLAANPLSSSELIGGYVPTANFLEDSDIEEGTARPDAGRHDANLRLKLTYNIKPEMTLDWMNTFDYSNRRISQANNVLMNSSENPHQEYAFWNSQLQFKHKVKTVFNHLGKKVGSEEDFITDLGYQIDVTYQQARSEIGSFRHGRDFFKYGHVGEFNVVQVPTYRYTDAGQVEFTDPDGNQRVLKNFHEFAGYRDSLIGFTGSSHNPQLGSFTQFFYDGLGSNRSMQELVSRGGVLNGFNLPQVYSLYNAPGTVYGSYSESFRERFNVMAISEATIRPFDNKQLKHDVEFGLSFQQDASGYYNLNAAGLWQLMPLLANHHLQGLDRSNPIIHTDENGRFTDSVSYNVYVDRASQKTFDKNLRDKLIVSGYRDDSGNLIDETSRINIHALAPETFDLSMFSADELLNNGNPYVNYSGYDYQGNRVRGKKGLNNFLSDKANRPIDVFSPITAAAWLQDRFTFKDLVVRAGLRFERYDANQLVLKDPYSIYPVKQVGEVKTLNGRAVNHPAGIGDDYAVYVDNSDNPTEVIGYRKEGNWFDADGNSIADPSILANNSSSGQIQPYLVDPQNQELSMNAFKTFKAQNLFLPRLSVSFPLNSTSLLFMSYDKMAQNPTVGQTYLPFTSYFYLQGNTNGVLPNPELKARVKTEYVLGMEQAIGNYSSMKLWASFATIRNDFNQFRVEQAYPYSYTTYTNIDFSTIKRYVAEYRYVADHLRFNGSYALQFADGTGSNANSAATLIQSGQPNLRSFFPLSFDTRHALKGALTYQFGYVSKDKRVLEYNGPFAFGKPILQGVVVSLGYQSLSGRPYTSVQRAVSEAQRDNGVVQRAQVKGNPFGSRLPWMHEANLALQKGFRVNGKQVTAYMQIDNLLGLAQVRGVYAYTGEPDNDGYLNSPHGQQQVQNQLNAQTFEMLYRMRMLNPGNFGEPRMIHIGTKLQF